VSAKKRTRQKHVPQRTCVGCRETLAKRELIRIVRRPEGIEIDRTGKLSGRGAYLHNRRSCWERGLRGSLARALKTELTESDQARLHSFALELPEDLPQDAEETRLESTTM
jgi:uncharacterized protein